MKGNTVQLRPNIPTWTPPPPYPPMSFPYTYLSPPYVPNQMWGMPPYPFGMPQYLAWGAPQTLYSTGWHLHTRPIERRSIRSPDTGPTRLPEYSASKADQSGRGVYNCSDRKNNKKGYHQNRFCRCHHTRR
jgi:hypothetical protein